MNSWLLFALRAAMGIVWLYNGLWLKLLAEDARHLQIVSAPAASVGMDPRVALATIGAAETVLALMIFSGIWFRLVQSIQILVVLGMNIAGILFGSGAIEHPWGLIISNLPLIACAMVIIVEGPGAAVPGHKPHD